MAELTKLKLLNIYRRVHTSIKFDFSTFVFPSGSKLVWTVKASENSEELIKREFDESRIYYELITPEEAKKLIFDKYVYSLVLVLSDGVSLPQCLDSDIEVEGVSYGPID